MKQPPGLLASDGAGLGEGLQGASVWKKGIMGPWANPRLQSAFSRILSLLSLLFYQKNLHVLPGHMAMLPKVPASPLQPGEAMTAFRTVSRT